VNLLSSGCDELANEPFAVLLDEIAELPFQSLGGEESWIVRVRLEDEGRHSSESLEPCSESVSDVTGIRRRAAVVEHRGIHAVLGEFRSQAGRLERLRLVVEDIHVFAGQTLDGIVSIEVPQRK
jgi:hypothetical protein